MVVARVAHFDPRCPVCAVETPGIFRTGAVVPPPYPNPEYKRRLRNGETSQGGQHGHLWYHGTHFSPEEDDPDEEDPVVQEAGGRLRTPEWSGEHGERAHEHWNTDLGVHFSSLHHVAKDFFAKPNKGDIDSRVAHATLHMKNPKHFDSEHDMTHEAIEWAQKNGMHYLPKHYLAHERFEKGDYEGVADYDKKGIWHGVNTMSMPHSYDQRHAISRIDEHGPSWEEGDPESEPEHKEAWLATHPQRASVTEGYRQHLQSQGHDGVLYGNEHEGPQGHTSAIAFPETPVAIHKWEWFHPEHTRPADAQESAEKMRMAPDEHRQLKLFGSVPVPKGYHREHPESWGEEYRQYARENPHAAAVGQAQEQMRMSNPTWGMQMPDEESATGTARFMLGKAGHPRADTADIMYHPDPERGTSNTFRRSDGDVGAVLHPDRFDYGTMAHELAHLTHQHELGVSSGRGLSDEELHGPGFMRHYRRMADLVSRGAGDELHGHYQEALKRVQGHTASRRIAAVRMVPPEEYGKFQYPDYPQAKTPAALAKHFKKTSPKYYEDLKRSVQTNGFSTPVLVRWNDPRGKPLPRPQLMSGHHRSAIAHELGMHLPVADYDNHEDFDAAARSEQDWWSKNQRPVGDMPHTGASYTYRQTVMGPEGYEDRENTVEGPLYHGGRANLAPGEHLTIGRKPNEWGDDGGKSTHNYFTSNPDTAFSYAQQVGRRGRVYEVEPTGEFKMDHSADDFKTKHPVRIIREVPREEWPDWAKKASKTAASDWSFEHFNPEGGRHWRMFGGPAEEPRRHMLEYQKTPQGTLDFSGSMGTERLDRKAGPEVVSRMKEEALRHHDTTEHDPAAQPPPEPAKPKRRVYYHGTTMADVTHILPASHHGNVVFKSDTDRDFAYATPRLDHAWDYAQKASEFTGGRPRVYQVRPIRGHQDVEPDPTWDNVRNRSRGNNESDLRSRHGFEVLREMKAPSHVRDSYTDDEWGND